MSVNDQTEASASQLIDAKIASIADWRGPMLARMRALIHAADAGVVETVKWRKPTNPSGVPVWEHDGIVCTGEIYKGYVKLTFAKGAKLPDPAGLFNGSLNGNTMRAMDIREGATIDERAFRDLFRAAVARNVSDRAERRERKPS